MRDRGRWGRSARCACRTRGASWLVTGLFRSLRRGLPRGVTGDVGAPPSPIDGQWSHSDQPAIDTIKGDLFPGTSTDAHNPESSEAGLAAIAAHDPGFSREVFLEQVQAVFFVVEGAWTQRKPEVSRQVMADGLWQQHRVRVRQYFHVWNPGPGYQCDGTLKRAPHRRRCRSLIQ